MIISSSEQQARSWLVAVGGLRNGARASSSDLALASCLDKGTEWMEDALHRLNALRNTVPGRTVGILRYSDSRKTAARTRLDPSQLMLAGLIWGTANSNHPDDHRLIRLRPTSASQFKLATTSKLSKVDDWKTIISILAHCDRPSRRPRWRTRTPSRSSTQRSPTTPRMPSPPASTAQQLEVPPV